MADLRGCLQSKQCDFPYTGNSSTNRTRIMRDRTERCPSGLLLRVCILVVLAARQSSSFIILSRTLTHPAVYRHRHHHVPGSRIVSRAALPEISSILTAMEVFDGSTIVDPVVVSDVFWTSLKGKVIAVVIGQFLATLAFGALAWLVTSQISRVGAEFTNSLSNNISATPQPRGFRKATEIPEFNSRAPDLGKLLICLAIDIVGSSSEVVPILGELSDIVYAPVAATILRNLYGSNILFGLEFAEEILPLTDILPLATIW
jgi:hypothetical protein